MRRNDEVEVWARAAQSNEHRGDYEELIYRKYFNLSPRSPFYSKDWAYVELMINFQTGEVITRYSSRISSCYDKEIREKIRDVHHEESEGSEMRWQNRDCR